VNNQENTGEQNNNFLTTDQQFAFGKESAIWYQY
jgi:hypothetical protein